MLQLRNGNAFSLVMRCAAATLVVAVSCSDNPVVPPEPPEAALVTVTAPSGVLESYGDTVRLVAVVKDAEGNVIEDADVEWTSAQPAIATVDETGLATAVGTGTAVIIARSGNVEGAGQVSVFQAVRSIEATPSSLRFESLFDTTQMVALLRDARGNQIVGREIRWRSLGTSVITIGQFTGIATAVGNGTATLIARSNDLEDTVQVTVQQVPVGFRLDSLPNGFPGILITPRAGLVDARGNLIAGQLNVEFQSLDNAIATITSDRRIRALRLGTVVIRARSGSFVAERVLEVTNALRGVLPSSVEIDELDTVRVTGEVTVPAGVTLRINPGTVMVFDGPHGISVSGTLFVQGVPGDSVRFVSGRATPAPGDWAGLMLNSTATVLDSNGNHVSGTYLSHAVITHGGGIWVSGGRAVIEHNRIEANRPTRANAPFGAVALGGSNVTLRWNRIVNNSASGVDVSGTGRVQRNVVSGNFGQYQGTWHGGGMTLRSSTVVVEDNWITGNTSAFMGGGIMIQEASPTVRYNDIRGNVLTGPPNNGAGIGKNFFASAAVIEYNNVEDNTCTAAGDCAAVFLTDGFTGRIANNNIVNPGGAYELFLHIGARTGTIDAASNYWGTTSTATIDSRIRDRNDDAALSSVTYAPPMTNRISGTGPRP
jgi:hypothetical protein